MRVSGLGRIQGRSALRSGFGRRGPSRRGGRLHWMLGLAHPAPPTGEGGLAERQRSPGECCRAAGYACAGCSAYPTTRHPPERPGWLTAKYAAAMAFDRRALRKRGLLVVGGGELGEATATADAATRRRLARINAVAATAFVV